MEPRLYEAHVHAADWSRGLCEHITIILHSDMGMIICQFRINQRTHSAYMLFAIGYPVMLLAPVLQ